MTPRVVWCLGMYCSASTWLFNVVRLLHEQEGGQPRVHFFSGKGAFGSFGQEGGADLVKSHEIADEPTILELAKRAGIVFITVRDPRDAVTSLIQARSHNFARAVDFVEQSAKLCAMLRADKRAHLFRYESRFFEAPQTVSHLAMQLGIGIDAETAGTIFAANNRDAVEAYIAAMPGGPGILRDEASGDLLDPKTQWHTHHAGRSGDTGRWRTLLTAEQVTHIETRIPFFMT